jgi:ketosteroid isomerase-like protein
MIGRAQLSEVEHDDELKSQASHQKLTDELEIRRVVDEIDNACDLKDWKTLRSYFTDEVDIDFTSLSGGEPSKIKADDLIKGWETNLFAEKKTFHQRGNHRIEIKGDRAEAFSKGYAFNLLETGEVTGFWEVWGNYTHMLRREQNGWKVSGMTLRVIHRRGDEKVRAFVPEK